MREVSDLEGQAVGTIASLLTAWVAYVGVERVVQVVETLDWQAMFRLSSLVAPMGRVVRNASLTP